MRITIDTEKKAIIVPNSFYTTIDKMNKIRIEGGGTAVDYKDFVEEKVAEALKNPYLRQDDISKRR